MADAIVLGVGIRLFGETSDKRSMRLLDTRTVDDLAYLTYEVVRAAYGVLVEADRRLAGDLEQREPLDPAARGG